MNHRRSIFGPLLLIAAGVTWLLIKSGNIPSSNLWALTHVWPFVLIAAGLGLMLKPYWKYTSIVLDVIIVGGLMLAVLYAPKFGWTDPYMFSIFENGNSFIGPGVSGSGHIIAQAREVSSLDSVSLEYPAKVSITQGKAESVKIEADDDVLPSLQTQVRNGTLEIFYKRTGGANINPTKFVVITITVKDLKNVDFSSAGELTLDGLKTDTLDVSLSGAGNLKLNSIDVRKLSVNLSGAGSMTASGTADDLDLNISGFGGFKGVDLHSKNANVDISGAGGATVWVDDNLDANISGAGSVSYYGSAQVTKDINGIGGVNHQGNK